MDAGAPRSSDDEAEERSRCDDVARRRRLELAVNLRDRRLRVLDGDFLDYRIARVRKRRADPHAHEITYESPERELRCAHREAVRRIHRVRECLAPDPHAINCAHHEARVRGKGCAGRVPSIEHRAARANGFCEVVLRPPESEETEEFVPECLRDDLRRAYGTGGRAVRVVPFKEVHRHSCAVEEPVLVVHAQRARVDVIEWEATAQLLRDARCERHGIKPSNAERLRCVVYRAGGHEENVRQRRLHGEVLRDHGRECAVERAIAAREREDVWPIAVNLLRDAFELRERLRSVDLLRVRRPGENGADRFRKARSPRSMP